MRADSGGLSDAGSFLTRLLFGLGAVLVLLGLLYDPSMVGRFHFRGRATTEALAEARSARLLFGLLGAALLALGARLRIKNETFGLHHPAAVRTLLVLVAGLLPLVVVDRATRPFVERLTGLYVSDPELLWKHRAGIEDTYWGEPVRINSFGMRGPERGLRKRAGSRRLLFLGDSVVFGLCLKEEETLPARLEGALRRRSGTEVECLNTAVCGWSTWQQLCFLEDQGESWDPDLVVLGFVLNDVTERFTLAAFGGETTGAQLTYARGEGLSWWLAESGVYLAMHELRGQRARRESAAASTRERLTAYHLILDSDSDPVQAAWKVVLPEIESILEWCQARSIPFLLVVFPYALQVDNPESDPPQWILGRFAGRRNLPCLDLLPAYVEAAGSIGTPALFFDGLHPTARGSELAAEVIADFILNQALLP